MKYAIGLDVGIESVGYSVLELDASDQPMRIERLGSRIFDKAENPKDGSSLAAPRREARGARRRLRRHRHRLERIRGLIVSSGMLTKEKLEKLYEGKLTDVYELRVRALDHLVSPEEFARILIHLGQRRGYKANRKSDARAEDGKILGAVSENTRRCIEKGYRTVGEMLCLDEAFSTYKRNKQDEYIATVDRASIEAEAKLVFAAQRRFGADYADEPTEDAYLNILLGQRSFADGPACGPYSGNQVERMRGPCTFEANEVRAAKASYSFQLFNLLQRVNHIRIISEDGARSLDEAERKRIIELAHDKKEVTYAQIRKHLGLPITHTFNGVRYENGSADEQEKKTKIKDLDTYHKIRKCIESISKDAFLQLTHDNLDSIGEALCKNQSDEKIISELSDAHIPENIISALLELPNFAKFGHLSVKACKKILPFLYDGFTYDKACEMAGYDFKAQEKDLQLYLPPLPIDEREITSPVVKRSVSQTIKVVNAIIREMGTSPTYINIELARELSRDFNDRNKIKKAQDENAEANEKLMNRLLNEYGVRNPTGQDLIKMKLWQEQDGRCIYSGEAIEIERLTEPGYVDIDHIIPYSICFDDRMVNKVLVLAKENRQKGNNLPMQYLQGKKREEFVIRVNQSNLRWAKKVNLLKETLPEDAEWKQRNLQDTQFIAAYLRGYIERNLIFSPFNSDKKRHVTAVNGAITSYVRRRWGVRKLRENGDLHHAVDAVVIGCITQKLINQISRYSYYKETKDNGDFFIDEQTGEVITKFPTPWPHFLDELCIRTTQDADNMRKMLRDVKYDSYSEIDLDLVKPPFVSRMCNRKNSGAAHKETVRSGRLAEQGLLLSKVSLVSLKLDSTGEIKGYYSPESDRLLYEALKKRLSEFGGDGKKAFSGVVFHKPKADGTEGPIVKKVKVLDTSSAFVRVQEQKGAAENENMVRCDVFFVEDDGYYFVPVYVADTVKDTLPQYAPMAGRDSENRRKRKLMSDEDFVFSLYPNDLIRICSSKEIGLNVVNKKSELPEKKIVPKEKGVFLYYRGMDVSTASLSGITDDNTYSFRSIGKTMQLIEKYEVDVLGNVRKVGREKRTDYAKRKK